MYMKAVNCQQILAVHYVGMDQKTLNLFMSNHLNKRVLRKVPAMAFFIRRKNCAQKDAIGFNSRNVPGK